MRPLYVVADNNWKLGLSLGSIFHVDTRRRLNLTCETQILPGTSASCTEKTFQEMWTKIIREYNTSGGEYDFGPDRLNKIVRESKDYAPK